MRTAVAALAVPILLAVGVVAAPAAEAGGWGVFQATCAHGRSVQVNIVVTGSGVQEVGWGLTRTAAMNGPSYWVLRAGTHSRNAGLRTMWVSRWASHDTDATVSYRCVLQS